MTFKTLTEVTVSQMPLHGQTKQALLAAFGDVTVYDLAIKDLSGIPGMGRKRRGEVREAIETVSLICRLRNNKNHAGDKEAAAAIIARHYGL